ncbi:putative DD41D transposase [Trichonephila clavipes]|nr:putative DD41D transposase [Trichonephila clavipes]
MGRLKLNLEIVEALSASPPTNKSILTDDEGSRCESRSFFRVHTGYFSNIRCQVIYSQFGLAIHQNDHQARRRFVKWAQNEIAIVPDFHKRILFSDEAHFWLNGYVNKQNCRIWSETNPQVYVETPLHPEQLTVWCALWAGGIIGPYFF